MYQSILPESPKNGVPSENDVFVQIIDLRSAEFSFGHVFDGIVVNSVSRKSPSVAFKLVKPVPIIVTCTYRAIFLPHFSGSSTGCILSFSLIGLVNLINAI